MEVISEDNNHNLPEHVYRAFKELGNMQRGEPEIIMTEVQGANGGGVLNYVVEHVGDLTNRMSGHLHLYDLGYDMVMTKVDRTYHTLSSRYGFDKEYEENLVSNAKYFGISYEEHKNNVETLLSQYGNAHSKLPVYNRAQKIAKMAAVSLGHKNWNKSRDLLRQLNGMFSDVEAYKQAVTEYTLDENGQLVKL